MVKKPHSIVLYTDNLEIIERLILSGFGTGSHSKAEEEENTEIILTS